MRGMQTVMEETSIIANGVVVVVIPSFFTSVSLFSL